MRLKVSDHTSNNDADGLDLSLAQATACTGRCAGCFWAALTHQCIADSRCRASPGCCNCTAACTALLASQLDLNIPGQFVMGSGMPNADLTLAFFCLMQSLLHSLKFTLLMHDHGFGS